MESMSRRTSPVVSHLQFRFGGRNPNWMQPLVGVLALGVLGLIRRV
jgi:hypothetical protein